MDESGLLMAPLRRRTWAPVGRPPALSQKAGHREKVSVAGALWLSPGRDRLGLAFQALTNAYFDSDAVADFIRGAVPGLGGPAVVIWDGGSMHKGDPIREALRDAGGLLDVERLPAYAPELLPVEQLARHFHRWHGRPSAELYAMAGLVLIKEFQNWTVPEAVDAVLFRADV